MTLYDQVQEKLRSTPSKWLVTGAAGFIGSHLVEKLLSLDQDVVGLDNFSNGRIENLQEIQAKLSRAQWARFRHVEGDIRDLAVCRSTCEGIDRVLHQAALGSVPRSLADPIASHGANVSGFLNLLVAIRDTRVERLVFASSSSVYGDNPVLPRVEHEVGHPLSPYAATKAMGEVYAEVFRRCYGLNYTGLRYFNVFGPRQNPNGAYAAVIPKWFDAMIGYSPPVINGDGETSRDFCYVGNVVQANILAGCSEDERVRGRIFNIAAGQRATLNELYANIQARVVAARPGTPALKPQYAPERQGDVRHSLADISMARELLGYEPHFDLLRGLDEAAPWYLARAHQIAPA